MLNDHGELIVDVLNAEGCGEFVSGEFFG